MPEEIPHSEPPKAKPATAKPKRTPPKQREEAPPWTSPLERFGYHLQKDWSVLKQKPIACVSLFALGAIAIWFVVVPVVITHKDGVIAEKEAMIVRKDSIISDLTAQIGNATNVLDFTVLPKWVDRATLRYPVATTEDMQNEKIYRKTIFVSQIEVKRSRLEGIGPASFQVTDKTFQECDFVGPATVTMFGEVTLMERCMLYPVSGARLESHFLLMQDRYVFGAVPFRDCGFLGCTFRNIAFAGTAEALVALRTGLSGKVQKGVP